jgi:hypothetical protein
MTKDESINNLIRDITKAGFMAKSEARRRIEALLEEQREEIIQKLEDLKQTRQFPLAEKVLDRVYDCDVVARNKGLNEAINLIKKDNGGGE